MDVKCCKQRPCLIQQSKCPSKPFYNSDSYYKSLLFVNIIIILARLYKLNFSEYTNIWALFGFLLWLEIQILFFFVLFHFFIRVIVNILYVIEWIRKLWIGLISDHKAKGILKILKLNTLYNYGYKLYCLVSIIFLLIYISIIIVAFLVFLFIFGPLLLGYTNIGYGSES